MGSTPVPDPAIARPMLGDAAERRHGRAQEPAARDLRVLRRVRTLARLRRAGLSQAALVTMLPELASDVESLQVVIDPLVPAVLPE